MNLNLINFGLFFLAIYMVAFFVDRKAFLFLVACVTCELVGRLPIFSWALYYDYGATMFMLWGLIYAMASMVYFLECKYNKRVLLFSLILVGFQLAMVVDSKWSLGSETFLYNYYEYIITIIHCCIVSSFIARRSLINFVDEFITSIKRIITTNGYLFYFKYNIKKIIDK